METEAQKLDNKQAYRDYLRKYAPKLLAEVNCAYWDASVCTQIEMHPAFVSAQRIGVYMAMKDEPDLSILLERYIQTKEFYIPRVDSATEIRFYHFQGREQLRVQGKYQLSEPIAPISSAVDPMSLELLIVPALAFDSKGYRLGRGKGYYDRFIPQSRAYLLGVCYPLLTIETLHPDPWDIPMDEVIAPTSCPALPPSHSAR